jgi:hypothetical protein
MRLFHSRTPCRAARALAFALVPCATATAAIPQTERDALIALYTSTDGPHWRHQDRWNGPPGTECTWYRVLCDEPRRT